MSPVRLKTQWRTLSADHPACAAQHQLPLQGLTSWLPPRRQTPNLLPLQALISWLRLHPPLPSQKLPRALGP
jgi:hypothetical protein